MRRFLLFLLAIAFTTVRGDARELHWDELAVEAHLDAKGQLHVDEKQIMVFSGDWNGGERIFNIRPGQRLELQGMGRIDPATGAESPMSEGSLDEVNNYALAGGRTLRWRSRSPSDPPFDNASIGYVLHYTLSNILQKDGEQYVLDHDFAFPDRVGSINHFSLHLNFDPVWQAMNGGKDRWTAGPLPPGKSFVLKIPLRYTGDPSGVSLQPDAPLWWKVAMASLLGVPLLLLAVVLLRERSLGRLEPVVLDQIDRKWMTANIFNRRPEVVGAIWDREIGSDEVSSTLARMVTEGKLASRITQVDGDESLELDLKVPRSSLQGYELELIDGLFFDGDHTSTAAISKHYKSTGFNPTTKITDGLQQLVNEQAPPGKSSGAPGWVSSALFLALTAYLIWMAVKLPPMRAGVAITGFVSIILAVLAIIAPSWWKKRLDLGVGAAFACLIPGALFFAGGLAFVWASAKSTRFVQADEIVIAVAGATLWVVCCGITALSSNDSREAIAFRKALATGRLWIRRELEKDRPDLDDQWLPFVLAFGLGKNVRKWYSKFGVAGPSGSMSDGSHSFGSSGSSSSSGASWSGGGGAFGGAGATGAWSAAAAGMAAGVASPSSGGSSGGGGGGGGGSSGGGGGGGW